MAHGLEQSQTGTEGKAGIPATWTNTSPATSPLPSMATAPGSNIGGNSAGCQASAARANTSHPPYLQEWLYIAVTTVRHVLFLASGSVTGGGHSTTIMCVDRIILGIPVEHRLNRFLDN